MSRNIGGDNQDLSYRYKMPRLVTKVEGRGNGIKTRLVNIVDVAKALHRDPAYITKYFGCELGAQARVKESIAEYIVNGEHDTKTFDNVLDTFISKYVLCPVCKMPETDLVVKKQNIHSICNACGDQSVLNNKHRIDVYIVKNPPKESDRVKVKAKKTAQKPEDDMAQKAQTLKIKEEDDAEWSTDVSDAAAQARMSKADKALKDLIQIEEDEPDTPEGKFEKILKDSSTDADAKFKAIRGVCKSEKIGNIQRTTMVFNTLFSDNFLAELAKAAPIIKVFCSDPRTHKTLFTCFELLLEKHTKLVPRICDILQGFYEFELVPEDFLRAWIQSSKHKYKDPSFHSKVVTASQPFFDWLDDDEEESTEDEESEESEEEFVPVPASTPAVSVTPTTAAARKFLSSANDDDDDSSEIDLDDL